MAQLVVRNVENAVKLRLQRRARRNGRSMEEEVREILRNAASQEDCSSERPGLRDFLLICRRLVWLPIFLS